MYDGQIPDARKQNIEHILRFGLRFEEQGLSPTAVLRARARIHDAPSRTYHLKGQITRRAAAWPPTVVWEERKRDDPTVLVALEELAFESSAEDVLFEPCERLVGVRLCRFSEMRTLWRGVALRDGRGGERMGITSGASTPNMRMWIVFLTKSAWGLGWV